MVNEKGLRINEATILLSL